MSGSIKLGLIIIVSVLVIGFAAGLIRTLVGAILPIALVAGVGLIIYGLVSRKALGTGRRRYLP